MGEPLKIFLRFLVLVLVQGTLLINIDLMGSWAHVNLYVLFIIMLPFRMSPLLVMLLALVLGLSVDMFYNSPGLHASASVFAAFIRPSLIRALEPRDDYDINDRPTIGRMGFFWFLKMTAGILITHSVWLFLVESFGTSTLVSAFGKAILTTLVTTLVIIVVGYLFNTKRAEG